MPSSRRSNRGGVAALQQNTDENIPPFQQNTKENVCAKEDSEKNVKVEEKKPLARRAPATPQPRCPLGPASNLLLEDPWSEESARSKDKNDDGAAFPVLLSQYSRKTASPPAGAACRSLGESPSLRRLRLYTQHVAPVTTSNPKNGLAAGTGFGTAAVAVPGNPPDNKNENQEGTCTERLVKWCLPTISDEEAAAERRLAAEAQARSLRLRAVHETELEKTTWGLPLPADRTPPSEAEEEEEEPLKEDAAKKRLLFPEDGVEAVTASARFLDFCRFISFPRVWGFAGAEGCAADDEEEVAVEEDAIMPELGAKKEPEAAEKSVSEALLLASFGTGLC